MTPQMALFTATMRQHKARARLRCATTPSAGAQTPISGAELRNSGRALGERTAQLAISGAQLASSTAEPANSREEPRNAHTELESARAETDIAHTKKGVAHRQRRDAHTTNDGAHTKKDAERTTFTVFGVHKNGSKSESYVDCETIDEALCHLRELIASELGDPDGPLFASYAISVAHTAALKKREKGLAAKGVG